MVMAVAAVVIKVVPKKRNIEMIGQDGLEVRRYSGEAGFEHRRRASTLTEVSVAFLIPYRQIPGYYLH
jgi:hypothetical protein